MLKRPIANILMRDPIIVESLSEGIFLEKPISNDIFPKEFLDTLNQYSDKHTFLRLVLKELQEYAIDEFLVTTDFRSLRTIQLARLFLSYSTKDFEKLNSKLKNKIINLIVSEIKHLRVIEKKYNIKLNIKEEDEEVFRRILAINGFSREKDG